MRYLLPLLSVLLAGCAAGGHPPDVASSRRAGAPLTPVECVRLVQRAFPMFADGSPGQARMTASCDQGVGDFDRAYYDCVFGSKYSNPFDCSVMTGAARGAAADPVLAARKVGDQGRFSAAARSTLEALYRDHDPHTTIDAISLRSYLDRRDDAFAAAGQRLPVDPYRPTLKASWNRQVDGHTYWVVREDFPDLQLLKIMRDDASGAQELTCARYGSSELLRTDRGYCAALLQRHFHASLAD